MTDEPDMTDVIGAILELRKHIDGRLDTIDARLAAASDEREAIRQTIDNDTATYRQAAALEIKVEGLSDDMRKVARALAKAGVALD